MFMLRNKLLFRNRQLGLELKSLENSLQIRCFEINAKFIYYFNIKKKSRTRKNDRVALLIH